MIVFGVGVHADTVLNDTKYHGSGHLFAITTWAFGISIVLFIFPTICLNPAMAFAQFLLGNMSFSRFIEVSIFELAGGVIGAVIVYIMYADQFKHSYDNIDPVTIRNIFSTGPGVRNLPRNFFVEFFDTFIFLTAIMVIVTIKTPGIMPIGIGLLVWAIGMGLGGPNWVRHEPSAGPRPTNRFCHPAIEEQGGSRLAIRVACAWYRTVLWCRSSRHFAKFYLGL